jgi:apolipoprotein N-acyltransferase
LLFVIGDWLLGSKIHLSFSKSKNRTRNNMTDTSLKFKSRLTALRKVYPAFGAVVSGVLLFLSFPPHGVGVFGWIALVPLMLVCSTAAPRRAAFLGWLSGAVFFVGSLYWLRHVTWAGYLALAAYCALYFIPFAVLVALRPGGWRSLARMKNIRWMAAAAVVWAASEYLRATLITGFPWNLLGVCQYNQITLIQIAELGGVYLLSALMVFVNAGIAVTVLQYTSGLRRAGYKMHTELMTAVFVLALDSSFGLRTLLIPEQPADPIRVALIQPNIPEVGNWELADPELIYSRLDKLTDLAARTPDLDLIIWPETALPDVVRYSPRSAALVKRFTAEGVPLLAGSMDVNWLSDGTADYYNASLLFDTHGKLLGTYRKQHLVLFGEYIPFEEKIPLINALTPINSSFRSGTESTLFSLSDKSPPFSVVICFEDTLPYLARRAALGGARWLINQTNDSWFDPDSGSAQHMAHAVFRAIETRLPLLRCTNTGITCAIDARGRVQQTLKPLTAGFHVAEVHPAGPDRRLTFYTRHGDLFAQTCLLVSAGLFIGIFVVRRRKKTTS